MIEIMTCPECGYDGEVEETPVYEFADADDNRGQWISYYFCPVCDEILI